MRRTNSAKPWSSHVGEEIVEDAVERLLPQAGGAGVVALGAEVDAVLDGGCAQDAELLRELAGDRLGDEGGGAEGEVGAVLVAGADGHERRVSRVRYGLDVDPGEVGEE